MTEREDEWTLSEGEGFQERVVDIIRVAKVAAAALAWASVRREKSLTPSARPQSMRARP
jgi:hypothetical protein